MGVGILEGNEVEDVVGEMVGALVFRVVGELVGRLVGDLDRRGLEVGEFVATETVGAPFEAVALVGDKVGCFEEALLMLDNLKFDRSDTATGALLEVFKCEFISKGPFKFSANNQ